MMRTRSPTRLLLSLALLIGCSLKPSQAQKGESALSDLARKSSHVVVARVAKTEGQWVKGKILTSASLEVVESLKGPVAAKQSLTVGFLGGRVGVIGQDFSHEATLETGEVVLLFLSHPDSSGRLRILGEHGKQTLLRPGMAPSRLQKNRRLAADLSRIRKIVEGSR